MESDSENLMTESPENSSEHESNTLTSSFSDEESFNNALRSIKNKDLRKLLDIFTEKLDEQIERTNFLTRNNNIILTCLAACEQENKGLKKMVKDMEGELENFHDNIYNIECELIKNS